jgi:hypothetical protein
MWRSRAMRNHQQPLAEPAVRHHSDPEIERQLQWIRDLRRRADLKLSQVDGYRIEIPKLLDLLRKHSHSLARTSYARAAFHIKEAIVAEEDRLTRLQQEVRVLDREAGAIYDEIAVRMEKLDPSDLEFL